MTITTDDPLANAIYVGADELLVALSAPDSAPALIEVQLVERGGTLDNGGSGFLAVLALPAAMVREYFEAEDRLAAARDRIREVYDAYMEAKYPDDDDE